MYENFVNIKNIANVNILKCYKVLFSKRGIIKNYGCLSLMPLLLIHFIIIILFYAKNLYKKIEEKIKAYDIMSENIEKCFTSEEYDTSGLENGTNDIIQFEQMTFTLTTTQNQKNDKQNANLTTIDLGECEQLLRKAYNIPKDEMLFMKKVDVIIEGMKIPKVEYDVYSKLNGSSLIKLNLSYCSNSKVDISVPTIIFESIDKLNSSSGYYNDICYTATSDSGTDIILNDRKSEFVEGNKTYAKIIVYFQNMMRK